MKNSFKHDIRLQKTKTALANGITVAVSMRYGTKLYIKDGHNLLVMTPQTEAPMLKSGTLMCSSF